LGNAAAARVRLIVWCKVGSQFVADLQQILAPLIGLYHVRGGHSAVLLRQAHDQFCGSRPRSTGGRGPPNPVELGTLECDRTIYMDGFHRRRHQPGARSQHRFSGKWSRRSPAEDASLPGSSPSIPIQTAIASISIRRTLSIAIHREQEIMLRTTGTLTRFGHLPF
jgi:hypothetical protein